MNFRPISDNILVRMDAESETVGDAGLLIRPENAAESYIATGVVVDQGPGAWAKKGHSRVDSGVVVGDGVVFVRYNKEVQTNKQFRSRHKDDEIILKPKDIIAVYNREEEGKIVG